MPLKSVPDISFIVTAHCKPSGLVITLASLKNQIGIKSEILVSNNAKVPAVREEISEICTQFHVKEIRNNCVECYAADNLLSKRATGRYLCFPSEEDYYTPIFGKQLIRHADRFGLHLAYCDCVYDSRYIGSYEVLRVQPIIGHIDKGGFLISRKIFPGFPDVPETDEFPAFCDGFLVEKLRVKGISFGKICEVLWVHN